MLAASPAAMSSPASTSAAAFWVIRRASSISMCACASGWAIAWWEPIGALKTVRSLAYADACSRAWRASPVEKRGRHDPLGVEAGEELHEAAVLVADERVGGQPDVVDEDLELQLRADDLHRDRR